MRYNKENDPHSDYYVIVTNDVKQLAFVYWTQSETGLVVSDFHICLRRAVFELGRVKEPADRSAMYVSQAIDQGFIEEDPKKGFFGKKTGTYRLTSYGFRVREAFLLKEGLRGSIYSKFGAIEFTEKNRNSKYDYGGMIPRENHIAAISYMKARLGLAPKDEAFLLDDARVKEGGDPFLWGNTV